jgi:hypothetical protein
MCTANRHGKQNLKQTGACLLCDATNLKELDRLGTTALMLQLLGRIGIEAHFSRSDHEARKLEFAQNRRENCFGTICAEDTVYHS